MDLLQQYAQFLANGGLLPYALKGLDYLRRSILGGAPATTGLASPYTPPFIGGQCTGTVYEISFTQTHPNPSFNLGGSGSNTRTVNRTDIGNNLTGAITGFSTFVDGNGTTKLRVTNAAGTTIELSDGGGSPNGVTYTYSGFTVIPRSGQPNNCGNLPNPNPAPSPATDGLATSTPPNFSGAAVEGIISGTALAADGSATLLEDAEDDFNDAGVLAPTDIPGAIAKIALGLAKLIQVVRLINDLIALLKKLFNKGNKSSFSYNFGNLRYDGFIYLQSDPPSSNITPLYLDLQTTSVKVGASRVFGEKSPNYYNREPVGYIHFVSPTYGVLSSYEIRFTRTSIPIPSLAYGFFYNLGLDGVNRANATGFYLKQEE